MKHFAILVLFAISVAAQSRNEWVQGRPAVRQQAPTRESLPFTAVNAASGRGVLAPSIAAKIKGSGFARESYFAGFVSQLPTSLGGVSVRMNGVQVALYGVTPTEISFLVPDTRAHSLAGQWIVAEGEVVFGSWQKIEITSSVSGVSILFTPVAEYSPGVYVYNGVPQGLTFDGQVVGIIGQTPVKAGSQVSLKGTGLAYAAPLTVYISSEDGEKYYVLPGRPGIPDIFPWIDSCGFDLPFDLKGLVKVVIQAGSEPGKRAFSNEVWFTVE